MEIQDLDEVSDHKIRRAADNFEMLAGAKLKIEVGDDEELNTEVPEGKIWEMNILVHIIERDE